VPAELAAHGEVGGELVAHALERGDVGVERGTVLTASETSREQWSATVGRTPRAAAVATSASGSSAPSLNVVCA
jgi:hypothetical protein